MLRELGYFTLLNITITISDIIHHPVFYSENDVSEAELSLETETSSIYWTKLRRFYLKKEGSILRNIAL
jgi:hypothetical protein